MKKYTAQLMIFLLIFSGSLGFFQKAEAAAGGGTLSPSIYQQAITYLGQYHAIFDSLESSTSLAKAWAGLKLSYISYEQAVAKYGELSEQATKALDQVDKYFKALMESMATYMPNTTAFFLIYIRPMTEERGTTQVGDLIDCASSGGGGEIDVTQDSSSGSDPSTQGQGSGTNSSQGADENGNDEAPLSNTCVIPPDVVWGIFDKLELIQEGDYFYALNFSHGMSYIKYVITDNGGFNAYTVLSEEAYGLENNKSAVMGFFIAD